MSAADRRPPSKILVAPLNWGLGHASRSIPIVNALLEKGCEVVLASDGGALDLLRAEFPALPAFALPGYDVRYFSENMAWNIARQLPKILRAVRSERRATERLVDELGITGIVSDNRYGCFSPKIPSAILTHQLFPVVPFPGLAGFFLKKALSNFGEIWVPDHPEPPGLSTELSHGKNLGLPVEFIGPLSRMRPAEGPVRQEYDVAVVLSGPEPQRTLFEKKLMEQALALPNERFLFVLGKTARKEHFLAAPHIEVASFLTSEELRTAILSAEMVVCRSGYSSLMDLVALRENALLVATPGQTEQELLARHFSKMEGFVSQSQSEIDLLTAIWQLRRARFEAGRFSGEAFLDSKLDRWLGSVR